MIKHLQTNHNCEVRASNMQKQKLKTENKLIGALKSITNYSWNIIICNNLLYITKILLQ